MLRRHRWSTLNTLIALAVVAAATAVSMPLWHGYGARQHIAEALKDADAMKVVVLEAATVRGGLAEVRATDLHYNPGASVGTYVASAEIADGGLITLHTRDTGISPDPVLMLIPREKNGTEGAEITWTCQLVLRNTPLSPPDCQSQAPQNRSALVPGLPNTQGTDSARALAHARANL